jgi:hypothetical protein
MYNTTFFIVSPSFKHARLQLGVYIIIPSPIYIGVLLFSGEQVEQQMKLVQGYRCINEKDQLLCPYKLYLGLAMKPWV